LAFGPTLDSRSHTLDSYLGPTVPNYATTWPLMTAIDALVSHRISFDPDSKVHSVFLRVRARTRH
jgi:hypothetical protein